MRSSKDKWRLLLGPFAQEALGGLNGLDQQRDAALGYLYNREYRSRGITPGQGEAPAQSQGKGASLDPTQVTALDWLGQARVLFPSDVYETLKVDAVNRYKLVDLLKDPRVLADLEPSPQLLRTVMSLAQSGDGHMLAELNRMARQIIDDLVARLRMQLTRALSGRRNRNLRSHHPSAANFDARATIRANLQNWQAEEARLLAETLRFNSRAQRKMNKTVILCVDQSGSMSDSLIFSALFAAVLSGLPGVTTKLVLFDTSVVDLSDKISDPLSVLLSVRLGGGTDIGKAVSYCETLVSQPSQTILAVISDFFEGVGPKRLLSAVARLHEARVKLLGIAALNDAGQAVYDQRLAADLADLGMPVAALSPDRFADWLAGELS